MHFPSTRLRRLRKTDSIRRMFRETILHSDALIQPFFVVEEKKERRPVKSMPGVEQLGIDELLKETCRAVKAGIRSIILFGVIDEEKKDAEGMCAVDINGIVQSATKALKQKFPELVVIADLCFCEYTEHGHCGPLKEGEVDNDKTIKNLGKQAVSLAEAGVDIIAPSGMMDGAVQSIRSALDEQGYMQTMILSYAVKFASAFYGPFREAAASTPKHGDRKSYQMDPANRRQAFREAELDYTEGADALMVKPAIPYLDLIRDLRERFDLPIAAYCVSGEYSMIEAAAEKGMLNRKQAILELLTSIRRAGADLIITYWATEVSEWLTKNE